MCLRSLLLLFAALLSIWLSVLWMLLPMLLWLVMTIDLLVVLRHQ
jgi:hypothetical protein